MKPTPSPSHARRPPALLSRPGFRSSRARRRAFPGPGIGLLAAAWALALLSACNPTKGSNPDAFRQSATTNFDFTQQASIPTGMQPVSVAIAPQGTVCQTADTFIYKPCPGATILPPTVEAICATGDPNYQAPNAAAANFIDDTVTFLKNDGSGNFTTQTIPTGLAPVQIKFADLKAQYGISTGACAFDMVVMLEQNLTGSGFGFTVLGTTDNLTWTRQDLSIGTPPAQFELMDMNNDGYIDIVASIPGYSQMWVYLNNHDGSGTFNTTPVIAPLSGEPGRFVVRDYLGNPLLDSGLCPYMAAVVPSPNHVDIAYNIGTCAPPVYTYTSYPTDSNPVDIVAGDLNNGDPYPDLLVLTTWPRVDVYLTQSSPLSFSQNTSATQQVRSSPSRMYLRKFDGTNPESVMAFAPNNAVQTIMYPAGAGGASQPPVTYGMWHYDLTPTPFDVAIGSFTASSCPTYGDIAVPASGNPSGSRLLFIGANDCSGNFTFTQIGFPDIPGEPAVARLRPQTAGICATAPSCQDMLVPFRLDNMVLYLRNNNG